VGDVGSPDRAQRAQHLDLLVAHGGRVELRRRLHRGQAQQLQQVVLQHVAHRAVVVVVVAAAFHAHGLGHGDLHLLDVPRIPDRLEHRIAEAQREQVLHAFLAEVVVHPVDARLVEDLRHAVVDHVRAGEVVADGLLQHRARTGAGEPLRGQLRADVAVEARRGGEVVDHVAAVAQRAYALTQAFERGGIPERGRHVVDALEQAAHLALVAFACRHEAFDGLRHAGAEGLAVELAARGAEDAHGGRQQAIAMQAVERGEQHPLREVAGGAEDREQRGRCGTHGRSRGLDR
jgi:hypothetical protein